MQTGLQVQVVKVVVVTVVEDVLNALVINVDSRNLDVDALNKVGAHSVRETQASP
jgi:hypothetical protein